MWDRKLLSTQSVVLERHTAFQANDGGIWVLLLANDDRVQWRQSKLSNKFFL